MIACEQVKISGKSRYEPFDAMCSCRVAGSEDDVTGKLVYDRRGVLTLHVMRMRGVNLITVKCMMDNRPCIKRVVGTLDTGESVVLEDLRLTKCITTSSPHAVERSLYRVLRAFVGDQILDTRKFNGVSATFAGLLEWMNPLCTKTDFKRDTIMIEYNQPKGPKLVVGDGMTLEVWYSHSILNMFGPGEVGIVQSAEVYIDSKTSVPLTALCDKVIQFGRLLMLATDARMPPTSIRVRAGKARMAFFGGYRHEDAENNLDIHGFDFQYADVRDHFKEMVKGWFEFYEENRASLDLYFDARMHAQQMSVSAEFLIIVQSLEALHRADHSDKQQLAKRISDLLEIPYDVLGSNVDKQEFAKKAAKTRNYYAHGQIKKHNKEIPRERDLAEMTSRLELLMFAHLIDRLKIPDDLKKMIVAKKIPRVYKLMNN